jgi:hypothetical protein
MALPFKSEDRVSDLKAVLIEVLVPTRGDLDEFVDEIDF